MLRTLRRRLTVLLCLLAQAVAVAAPAGASICTHRLIDALGPHEPAAACCACCEADETDEPAAPGDEGAITDRGCGLDCRCCIDLPRPEASARITDRHDDLAATVAPLESAPVIALLPPAPAVAAAPWLDGYRTADRPPPASWAALRAIRMLI